MKGRFWYSQTRSVPVVAFYDGGKYLVRPLFAPQYAASHRIYTKALTLVRKQIQKDRVGVEQSVLHSWSPSMSSGVLRVAFNAGKDHIHGPVFCAWFRMAGRTYVIVPRVQDLERQDGFFTIDHADPTSDDVARFLQRVLREVRANGGRVEQGAMISGGKDRLHGERITIMAEHDGLSRINRWRPHQIGNAADEFAGDRELDRCAERLEKREDDTPFVGDDDAVEAIVHAVSHAPAVAIALVAPLGRGKIDLLREAVARLELMLGAHKAPYVWMLDPSRIIVGMSIVGQWQRRLKAMLDHLRKRPRRDRCRHRHDAIVLTNPTAILDVGRYQGSDYAMVDMLRAEVAREQVALVVTATAEEWAALEERDRPFCDLFSVIRLDPLRSDDLARVVAHQRAKIESDNDCRFATAALTEISRLHRRRLTVPAEPARTTGVLERLARPQTTISAEDVRRDFATISGLKPELFASETRIRADEVERFIRTRLIGQDQAVRALTDAIVLLKTSLHSPSRPVRSLLFIGPTGVGKTEAAKSLAAYLGDDETLVRIDMNEYLDDLAALRLQGSIDGREGRLASAVRQQPYRVILLDEIEKAHPAVHDLLLQVLGEGRLTDGSGRTADFTRSVIVMTSNLGADSAARQVGFAAPDQRSQAAHYREAVERFFRPEFLNRIDEVVPFHALDGEEASRLAAIQLRLLAGRDGLARSGVILAVDPVVSQKRLLEEYDASMGGRSLKRLLERDLAAPAAEALAAADPGSLKIMRISAPDGEIASSIIAAQDAEPYDNPILATHSLAELLALGQGLREEIDAARAPIIHQTDAEQTIDRAQMALAVLAEKVTTQIIDPVMDLTLHFGRDRLRPVKPLSARAVSHRGRPRDARAADLRSFLRGILRAGKEPAPDEGLREALAARHILFRAASVCAIDGEWDAVAVIWRNIGAPAPYAGLALALADAMGARVTAMPAPPDISAWRIEGSGMAKLLQVEAGLTSIELMDKTRAVQQSLIVEINDESGSPAKDLVAMLERALTGRPTVIRTMSEARTSSERTLILDHRSKRGLEISGGRTTITIDGVRIELLINPDAVETDIVWLAAAHIANGRDEVSSDE